MPITAFPNGISSFGVPLIGSGRILTTGNVRFVDSGHDNAADEPSNGTSAIEPFATLDYAIGRMTANNGDVIIVMPGHSETIETDGGLALDVAGVKVVGIGRGTDRPVIILDTGAAAAIAVSAANCWLENVEIRASFADITNAIDVTAKWFSLIDCEFTEEGADLNFLDYVHCSSTTNNNADGLRIEGCVGTAIDAGQNSFLNIKADLDRLVFNRNYYSSSHANTLAMVLCATGKDLTNCEIIGNRVNAPGKTSGDILVDNDTSANTGMVAHNLAGHADTAGEVLIDLTGARLFENYGTAANDASGYLLPTADS